MAGIRGPQLTAVTKIEPFWGFRTVLGCSMSSWEDTVQTPVLLSICGSWTSHRLPNGHSPGTFPGHALQ